MNTLEDKAKFFAQYYSQEILRNKSGWKSVIKSTQLETIEEDDYLELKPLSSISDEDAIWLWKCRFPNVKDKGVEHSIKRGKRIIEWGLTSLIEFDYFRSKGYALDWNGITVKQQIEFGWIKLKEL